MTEMSHDLMHLFVLTINTIGGLALTLCFGMFCYRIVLEQLAESVKRTSETKAKCQRADIRVGSYSD